MREAPTRPFGWPERASCAMTAPHTTATPDNRAVANALVKHPHIVDVGDALPIPGARAQTFRLID